MQGRRPTRRFRKRFRWLFSERICGVSTLADRSGGQNVSPGPFFQRLFLPFPMQKHVSVLPHSQFRCTQRPTPTHTFFRFSFQTHPDAMHTLSTIMVQGRIVKNHSIKVVLADLPYLSATETTSTTWTSCNPLAHILLRVGRNDMPDTNTGYEPDSELDMAGRFVPVVDLTHDDEDKYSHMSDIPLQLPASANVPPDDQASVTLSFMRNVPSLHPTQVRPV